MIIKTTKGTYYYRTTRGELIGDGTLETAKELLELLPNLEAAGEF